MQVTILFSLLFVVAAFADNAEESKCDAEVQRIQTEIQKCVNDDTFNFLVIHSELKKLNDGEVTEDAFKTYLGDFCPKALSGSRCGLEQIPTINEECQSNEKVQITKNMIRYYNTAFERMCKDDAQGYKDLIKNHGTKCFLENNDLGECWKTNGLVNYLSKDHFKNENICKFVQVLNDCQEHLDKCDNKDVKVISSEVHALFKQQMCQEP